MQIIVDTREKKASVENILKRFSELGISYQRKKLDTGDYVNSEDENSNQLHIVIDRKGVCEKNSVKTE